MGSEHEARSEEFFELFSSVFERNSKWSILNDVPKLGNMDDDIESVFNFYEFWRNFSAGEEEFDLEEAECREEKRWMERENKKLTKKMKQEKEKLRKKAERKAAKIRRREEANREAREEQERKKKKKKKKKKGKKKKKKKKKKKS